MMKEGTNTALRSKYEFSFLNSIHPRTKLDVGYRLSRSGLAIAYGLKNINYQGPMPNEVVMDSDTRVNVTYWSTFSSSIELRNPNGFEVGMIFVYNLTHRFFFSDMLSSKTNLYVKRYSLGSCTGQL
jgi:hypothetical protein